MTSEQWKTVKFWLETCAAAYVVVGAVLQYSVMAVPFIPTILKYGWPLIAGYAAFRIYQFGRSLYERFTKLELDVFGNAVDVDTRLGELEESLQASREEDIRNIEAKIEKTRKELDSQAYAREQAREKVLREEIRIREGLTQEVSELRQLVASQAEEIAKLESKFIELENALSPEKKRNAARVRIVKALTDQQVTPSLAEMTPGYLLATGAPRPKQYNSLADILFKPGTTEKPPTP